MAEAEAEDFDVHDPSYNACYVFRSPGADDDIDHDRPRKKRKTLKPDDDLTTPSWPRLCNGEESQDLVAARCAAFGRFWSKINPKLQEIVDEVDENALNGIDHYIETPDASSEKLRTAIVVSGADTKALKKFFVQRGEARLKTIHCELQSIQATNLQTALKSLIRDAIVSHGGVQVYNAHVAAHKRLLPMPFDLELLQMYMAKHKLTDVVVSMPDAETFDLNVLSEMIVTLASWKDRVSFAVVLSLATTVNLFESRVSESTMRLLDTEVFSLASSKDKFFKLFSAAQLGGIDQDLTLRPMLGSSVVNSLYEMSQDQSITTQGFVQAIKYTYLTHFFANSLSALLADLDDDTDCSSLCEAIRNTKSFQQHCTAILDNEIPSADAATVKSMLESDSVLLQYTRTQMRQSFETLRNDAASLQILASAWHQVDPSQSLFQHHQRLLQDYQHGTLAESDDLALLRAKVQALSLSATQALLTKLGRVSPNLIASHQPNQVDALLDLIRSPPAQPDPGQLFPAEALVITRTQLSTAFLPRPRFAITRALASPSDYLSCSCCSSTSDTRGIEPTSILYRLLDEAGREINVMDLWTTFRDCVLGTGHDGLPAARSDGKKKGSKANGTGKEADAAAITPSKSRSKVTAKKPTTNGTADIEADNDAETAARKVLTQFYTALAELKYLGLIKSTSDRRLNKGVEVLSKVAWQGL